MTVYALHENPEWFPPFVSAFERAGLAFEEWLLISGSIDLDAAPPEGVFWNRLSASSHTRGHDHFEGLHARRARLAGGS